MASPSIEERFVGDISKHVIGVEQDNGIFRCLHFGEPRTRNLAFRLITWPGSLCIEGDMGTYVFTRTRDMFEFFRATVLDTAYCAEKLVAVDGGRDRGGACKEFNLRTFKDEARQLVTAFIAETDLSKQDKSSLWAAAYNQVLGADFYSRDLAVAALYDFSWTSTKGERFDVDGDSIPDAREYTFHFLWCLEAIKWGIAQYDASRALEGQKDG